MSDADLTRRNLPRLALHVPEPPFRPGDTPDFSGLKIPPAGSAPRPDTTVPAADTHPLATHLVRVLGDDHKAVGPWDPKLNPETLRTSIALGAVAAAVPIVIIAVGSLVGALSTLAAAIGTTLLPLIVVGGPLLIGLGLIAAAFVKTGLDALAAAANAAQAAAQFKAALGSSGSYHFLRVHQDAADGSSRALFRMISANGLNYHDLVLGLDAQGKPVFNDVFVFVSGEMMSQTMNAGQQDTVDHIQCTGLSMQLRHADAVRL